MIEKKNILLGLIFSVANSCFVTLGQTTIDAEFRPRTEFRQGLRKPLADTLNAAFLTLQRTRFNVDYKSDLLNARLSLEDSRIWGNTDLKSNGTKIAAYEAWFEYQITSNWSLKMGRQPLKYDDNRLFSSPSWGNNGIAHDVCVIKYNSPFIQIHTGHAYNNSKDTLLGTSYAYSPKQNYKSLSYFWLSKNIISGLSLTLIGVCEGFEHKSDYKKVHTRITYGGNLMYNNTASDYSTTLTAYFQRGKSPLKIFESEYSDLKSFFLAAKASVKLFEKLSADVGIDYYSGSDATIGARNSNTFNRLYGALHNFNGNMEYFTTLPTQGLIDYYTYATLSLSSSLTAVVSGHLFYFDKDFIYSNTKTEKSLGSELDLVFNYVVSKEVSIQGGYSRFFNSTSTKKYFNMEGINTHPQQWAYLMLTVQPQLFKYKPN